MCESLIVSVDSRTTIHKGWSCILVTKKFLNNSCGNKNKNTKFFIGNELKTREQCKFVHNFVIKS